MLGAEQLAQLGLSPHVVACLMAWQRYFDDYFHTDGTWDSPEGAQAYADRGRKLRDRLARALPETDVTLDLWPADQSVPRR